MAIKMMLDPGNINLFSALFPGDINTCVDETHISFGAIEERTPAALAVIKVENDEFYIEWIYTAASYRNRGIMTELLNFVTVNFGKAVDIGLLNVICSGDKLVDFFQKNNFEFRTDNKWISFTSSLKDMKALDTGNSVNKATKLKDLTRKELNLISKDLDEAGEAAYGITLPVNPDEHSEFSCAYIADNKLKVLLLFDREEDGVVDVAFAYKAPGCEVLMLKLLMSVKDEIEKAMTPDCKLRAVALNESSEKLFKGLFPKAEIEEIYQGYCLVM